MTMTDMSQNLVYPNEKKLFFIAAIFATIFWLVLIVGTLGIALIYLLFIFIFYLFAQSGFVSMLKGNGVKISKTQYPDLYQRLLECCQKVGVNEVPEMYLLRTDFFNALAARFLGRNFIVLFTDVVDALSDRPDAVDFYIGHELGHIHRKHLLWGPFLFPALVLPLLGAGYRRAEEYTCDRYGTACCKTEEDVKFAIAAISAGDTRWKSLDAQSYVNQVKLTGGFWMSFHELTGDYPWLTKRMTSALAFLRGKDVTFPRRSLFAWFLAMFVPRFGFGGGGSLIIFIAIIGILAAIAIPAYNDYTIRAELAQALTQSAGLRSQVEDYVIERNEWPATLADLGYSVDSLPAPEMSRVVGYGIYEGGVIGIETSIGSDSGYVVFEPYVENDTIQWTCYGQDVADKHLPMMCRE